MHLDALAAKQYWLDMKNRGNISFEKDIVASILTNRSTGHLNIYLHFQSPTWNFTNKSSHPPIKTEAGATCLHNKYLTPRGAHLSG